MGLSITKQHLINPSFLLAVFQNAVSMYCRLGFAKKKGYENTTGEGNHPSWTNISQNQPSKK